MTFFGDTEMLWAKKSWKENLTTHPDLPKQQQQKTARRKRQNIVINSNQIQKSKQKGELLAEFASFLCNKKVLYFFKSGKRFT